MSKLCFITEADRREFLKTATAAAGAPGAGSLPSLGANTLQKFAGISPQLVDIIMRNALLNVTNNSDLLQRGATIYDGIFKGSEMFGWPATPKEEQALKNLKINKNDIAQYMASNPESLKHFYLEAVNFQNFSDLKNTLAMADNLLGGLFSKYEQARGVAGVLRDLFEMYGKCGKSAEYPLTNGVAIKPALQKLTTRLPEISKIFGDSLNSSDMHGFIKKANEKGLLDRSTSTKLQNIQRSDDEYKRKKAAISHKHRQEDREEQQKQAEKELQEKKDNEDQLSRWEGEGGSVLESRLKKALADKGFDKFSTTKEGRRKSHRILKEDITSDIKSLCQTYLNNGDFSDEGLLPIRVMVDLAYNSGEDVPDDIEMPSERSWLIIMTMTLGQRADYLRRLCSSFIKTGKFSLADMCEQCDEQPVADAEIQLATGEDTWTNWCYDCLKREADLQGIEWPTAERDTWSGEFAENH